MAIYGNPAMQPRRHNSQVCDKCGNTPEDRFHRLVVNGQKIRVAARSQKRKKLDSYYATKAGLPELAEKYLCPDCYEEIIIIVNRSFLGEN